MIFFVKEVDTLIENTYVALTNGFFLYITPSKFKEGDATINFGGRNYNLQSVIDTSQTVDTSRIFVVVSEQSPKKVLLLGGDIVCCLCLDDDSTRSFEVDKDPDLSELAYWKLVETAFGLLCIYEVGVFRVDKYFEIVWQKSKNGLDHFDKVDHEKVWFKFDHEVEWSIRLQDGVQDKG